MAHLVLVHGFLGSAMNWGPVLSKVNLPLGMMGGSIQAVDLLWHGRRKGSENPTDWTLEKMAEDLHTQIIAPSGQKIVGVGHSFGLRPLLQLSRMQPGFLHSLIVEDSSPQLSQRGFELLSKVFDEVPVPFASRDEAKVFLEGHFGAQSQMARFLLSNLSNGAGGQQNWRFQKGALQTLLRQSFDTPLWEAWENFQAPIHMILGADSGFVTEERLQECMERGARFGRSYEKVPGAAHWVHADQLEVFCDSLIKRVETFG